MTESNLMSSSSVSVSVFWLFKVGISKGNDNPFVSWYLTPKFESLLNNSNTCFMVAGLRPIEISFLKSLNSSKDIDSGCLLPNLF